MKYIKLYENFDFDDDDFDEEEFENYEGDYYLTMRDGGNIFYVKFT